MSATATIAAPADRGPVSHARQHAHTAYARAVHEAADGHPYVLYTAALDAALDAALGVLTDAGALTAAQPGAPSPEAAAVFLADAAGHKRYTGDQWARLVVEDGSVHHAATVAQTRYAGDPDMIRSVHAARDLLLRHIAAGGGS